MSITLAIIMATFPGRATLSPEELASLLNVSPIWLRKEVRAGRFLIRPVKDAGRHIKFSVAAIVTALEGTPPPSPRRRGRPTKAEQMAQQNRHE